MALTPWCIFFQCLPRAASAPVGCSSSADHTPSRLRAASFQVIFEITAPPVKERGCRFLRISTFSSLGRLSKIGDRVNSWVMLHSFPPFLSPPHPSPESRRHLAGASMQRKVGAPCPLTSRMLTHACWLYGSRTQAWHGLSRQRKLNFPFFIIIIIIIHDYQW